MIQPCLASRKGLFLVKRVKAVLLIFCGILHWRTHLKILEFSVLSLDCLNRWVLEASGTLEPRRSALEDDFEEEEEDKEEQPMEIDEPNGRENVSTLQVNLPSLLMAC